MQEHKPTEQESDVQEGSCVNVSPEPTDAINDDGVEIGKAKLRSGVWKWVVLFVVLLAGVVAVVALSSVDPVTTTKSVPDDAAAQDIVPDLDTGLVIPNEGRFASILGADALRDMTQQEVSERARDGLMDVGNAEGMIGRDEGGSTYASIVVQDADGTCYTYRVDADGTTTYDTVIQATDCRVDVPSDDVTSAAVAGIEAYAVEGLPALLAGIDWTGVVDGEVISDAANEALLAGGTVYGTEWGPWDAVYTGEVSVYTTSDGATIRLATIGAVQECIIVAVGYDREQGVTRILSTEKTFEECVAIP